VKIALVSTPILKTPPSSYGGLEVVVYWLGKELVKAGHEVTLIAAKGSYLEGAEVIETVQPPERVHVNWLELERKAYEVYKDMLKEFDVVHDHSWFGFPYMCKDALVVHTHHGHLTWRSKPPREKPNLVAISEFHKMCCEERLFGTTWKVAYNGIDISLYKYRKDKEDYYLFLSRIARVKMPHLAIRVAKKAGVKLIVAGGFFVEDMEYVRLIKDMCDGGQIIWRGEVSHEEKIELLAGAKALIFTPSPLFMEPFGLVPVEAMASGTPVISLISGATPEVINDGFSGFLCRSEDEMISKIHMVSEIKPENCRMWAEKFSSHNMMKRYEQLYYAAINEGW